MTTTYTEEEQRRIAEFAGWKWGPCEGCDRVYENVADGWDEKNELFTFQRRHVAHNIPISPLDDALAMMCLDELQRRGEEPQLTGLVNGWKCDSISVVTEALFDIRRDAIFMAVLALCQELGISTT